MQIQLRFAQSGHSQIFNKIENAQVLMQQIKRTYKIEMHDQKMISKCGNIIKTTQQFYTNHDQQPTNSDKLQKTYVIPEGADENTLKMKQIVCLYLFNEKNLLRNNDDSQPKERNDAYWMELLRDRCKTFDALRQNHYELKPLTEIVSNHHYKLLQKCKVDIITLAEVLHTRYKQLTDKAETYKQIKLQNDQLIHLCENQRKASVTLNKNLIYMENKVKKRLSQLLRASEKIKLQNQELLKEKSSFFDSKKKMEDNFTNCCTKIQDMKKNINELDEKIKDAKRIAKQKFKVSQNVAMQIDSSNSDNLTQIDIIQQTCKSAYCEFIDETNHFLQKELQENQGTQLYNKWDKKKDIVISHEKFQTGALKKIEGNYIDLCNLNYKNQQHIKKIYIIYDEILRDIVNKESEIKKLEKETQKNAISINSASKNIIKIQDKKQKIIKREVQRRIGFNKKLRCITNFTNSICLAQTEERYKFIDEISQLGDQKIVPNDINPLLKCIQIPRIELIYGNSTDEQIIEQHRQQLEDLSECDRIVFQSEYYPQLRKIQSQLRQFISTKGSLPIKMRNMQTILQKSSQIYYKMSVKKIQQIKGNYETMKQKLHNQVKQLKKEVEKEKYNHQQERDSIEAKSKEVVMLNKTVIEKLEMQITKLAGELAKLQEGKIGCESIKQQAKITEALQQQKNRNQKLNKDINQLKKKIRQQLNYNETMYIQLIDSKNVRDELQGVVQDFKIILGQKDIQIINLQEKIKRQNNSGTHDEDSDSSINSDEINSIKHQNLILNEEVQRLNQQLNKIILKDTEEVEVQVDSAYHNGLQYRNTQFNTIAHPKGRVVIGTEYVQVGQTYLFLPFSADKYVAVTVKQSSTHNQNTLSTVGKLNCSYVLDMRCLGRITHELLSECCLVLLVRVSGVQMMGQLGLVQGRIEYALGFQDDDITVKNYSNLLHEL